MRNDEEIRRFMQTGLDEGAASQRTLTVIGPIATLLELDDGTSCLLRGRKPHRGKERWRSHTSRSPKMRYDTKTTS